MSATTPPDMPYRDQLDIREQITRIDRAIAESAKFAAETRKLSAEGRKYRLDPFLLIAGAIVAGIFARLPEILRALGHG